MALDVESLKSQITKALTLNVPNAPEGAPEEVKKSIEKAKEQSKKIAESIADAIDKFVKSGEVEVTVNSSEIKVDPGSHMNPAPITIKGKVK
ncbi:MAG: hypothetical protein ACM34K_21485 [Bacillota bacterium]